MRNLLKFSVLLLSLLSLKNNVQAQFQTAIMPELNNPNVTGYADRAQTINAYSFSNVTMDAGGTYTLNIHTWNSPGASSLTGAGIAWNQIDNTGAYNPNYLSTPLTNKLSVDIVLTQTPQDSVCALLVYYEPGVGHFMDTYVWDEANNYLTLRATDQLSTASNFGWIHIDANNLDSFVVTWEENTRIYARAGQSKNITGAYPELASGGKVLYVLPNAVQQPDVALSNAVSTGQLMAHFTYIDFNDSVFEAVDTFSNLYLYAGGTNTFQVEDAYFLPGANMPRIDCPDHADDDDWSYVVEGRHGVLTYILAGVQAYAVSPSPQHFFLSDGSLTDPGGNPVLDLTMAKGQYYPVVAYDPEWKYIYYAWDLQDGSILSPYGTANAYIGFRMANNGDLATNRYWFLQTTPSDASFLPGIALSGQNDATDSFYMAYTKFIPPNDYYIGCKNVEWGSPTNSFRPGATGINVLKGDALISAFPNPFKKGFAICASDELANEVFTASLTDINGRVLTTKRGNIQTLNKVFEKENLTSGIYILNLTSPAIFKQIKLIKQ